MIASYWIIIGIISVVAFDRWDPTNVYWVCISCLSIKVTQSGFLHRPPCYASERRETRLREMGVRVGSCEGWSAVSVRFRNDTIRFPTISIWHHDTVMQLYIPVRKWILTSLVRGRRLISVRSELSVWLGYDQIFPSTAIQENSFDT